ncbi:MAG: Hsp20/alpha crystallin family protein [Planctomycetota bacterium]|nr:MAG: Hsp20/alpha crystallin family protein [Planctomycetota bacterium]
MNWLIRRKDGSRLPSLFSDDFGKLFEDFWGDFRLAPAKTGEWMPAIDISETDSEFTVKVEVPGIDPEDVDVSLAGDVLKISGEKKEEHEEEEKNYHRIERSYGSFMRIIKLPPSADSSKVDAASKDGIVTLTIAKREEEKEKKIEIKES